MSKSTWVETELHHRLRHVKHVCRVHDHILLRSPRSCNPKLQTMLRTLGATSDALWGRLLDVHPEPGSAVVVDVSVFRGSQCLDVSPRASFTCSPELLAVMLLELNICSASLSCSLPLCLSSFPAL